MRWPPAGYTRARVGGTAILAVPEAVETVRQAIIRAGSLHEYAADLPSSFPLAGRGVAYVMEAGPNERWVVRHYHRGGWLARRLGDRYFRTSRPRPFRELAASEAARSRGVPAPRVIAAMVRSHGPFYRADLATEYIPESKDLYEATLGAAPLDADGRVAAWRAAGALLREAFRAGVTHPDLNLRNVLVSGGEAWLLDLDRARVGRPVGARGRAAMLARLHRSRLKLEAAAGRVVDAAELAAFDEALRG